jgi:hypothetical protein
MNNHVFPSHWFKNAVSDLSFSTVVYQVSALCVILNVELRMTRKETTITHGKVQCYHFTGSGKGGRANYDQRTLIVIISGEFVAERLASVSCAAAKC